MSLHDEYARLTPFELALPRPEAAADFVDAVRAECEESSWASHDLMSFLRLSAADAFVSALAGPEVDAPALHPFGALAFHCFHYAVAECPTYVLSTHVARYLTGGAPGGRPVPPSPAGYLQLPQHLFWAEGDAGAPESIDGLFWTTSPDEVLRSMLVIGLRPDRAGIGSVLMPDAPLADAAEWLEVEARPEGADFSTSIPGGDIDGLYEIRTAGEVLKLLARFFAYAEGVPEALVEGAPAPPTDPRPGTPRPSRLAYQRVVLSA